MSKDKREGKGRGNSRPARKIHSRLKQAREAKDSTNDKIKYSIYIPIPLFEEIDAAAEEENRSVNQHILYILQLAYGHSKRPTHPSYVEIEGLYDDESDFEFPT